MNEPSSLASDGERSLLCTIAVAARAPVAAAMTLLRRREHDSQQRVDSIRTATRCDAGPTVSRCPTLLPTRASRPADEESADPQVPRLSSTIGILQIGTVAGDAACLANSAHPDTASIRARQQCTSAKHPSGLLSAIAVAQIADLVVVTHYAVVLTLHDHPDEVSTRSFRMEVMLSDMVRSFEGE